MVWVDFTIIGLLAGFWGIGVARGFTRQLYALVFWTLAFVVALNFTKEFSFLLEAKVQRPQFRLVAAFSGLLLITLALGSCIGFLLGEAVNKSEIGFFERFGGMFLGVVHGAVFVLFLVIIAGLTPLPADLWWQESKFLPPFQQVAILLRNHVSSGITEYINYR
jgi:membrane protein required for colicin V production